MTDTPRYKYKCVYNNDIDKVLCEAVDTGYRPVKMVRIDERYVDILFEKVVPPEAIEAQYLELKAKGIPDEIAAIILKQVTGQR